MRQLALGGIGVVVLIGVTVFVMRLRPAAPLVDSEPWQDVVTGNLDSKNGEAVMELLRELHREGSTICMVTHDPRYARVAQRAIHLFDGRVVEEDAAHAGQKEMEASGFQFKN